MQQQSAIIIFIASLFSSLHYWVYPSICLFSNARYCAGQARRHRDTHPAFELPPVTKPSKGPEVRAVLAKGAHGSYWRAIQVLLLGLAVFRFWKFLKLYICN